MRAWIHSHPSAADAVLAAILLGAALVSSHVEADNLRAGDPTATQPSSIALVAGAALVVLPLVLRRRAPLAVLLACTAGFLFARIVLESSDSPITAIALSLAVYSAAALFGGAIFASLGVLAGTLARNPTVAAMAVVAPTLIDGALQLHRAIATGAATS